MSRTLLFVSMAWSMLLFACAPTTQQTHLSRIEHRIVASTPTRAEANAALTSALAAEELSRRRLVQAVLARNPTLKAARAAWRSAAARYRQADALPDPVLSYTLAPASIFDSTVRFGQIVQLSQTIPWVGKMGSRGDVALHEADMEATSYEAARIELAFQACRLFDRYYVIARSLEINEAHQKITAQLFKGISAHVATGKGTLNDAIQVEVMRGHLEHDHMVLQTDREVIRAQLNTLLHRAPNAKLPPPPDRLVAKSSRVSQVAAEKRALTDRPEIRRAQAEHKSIEASIDLAQRSYKPDFTLFASYNSMWATLSHQFMFGVSAPLPVVVARREGAERAARARLGQNEATQQALTDRVRSEVFEARVRLREAQHVAVLYRERLIPLTEKQVAAVRRAFGSNEATFYEVLVAQRAEWTVQREWHQALALVATRRAELDRAMGIVPGLSAEGSDR